MRIRWPFTRKTFWEDMDDLTWLNYVTRNIHRVRDYGAGKDDGMLICQLALHSHFTVEIKAYDFVDLIKKGRQYEAERLMQNRKRKWRFRWRISS